MDFLKVWSQTRNVNEPLSFIIIELPCPVLNYGAILGLSVGHFEAPNPLVCLLTV